MKKYTIFCACLLMLGACRNITKKDTAKTEITIIGENSASIQSMLSLEKSYESKNNQINLNFKPNSFDDAFSKSNQDFANGTGLYDVILQYNFSLSSFVRNKYVVLADEMIKGLPDSLKAFEKDLFPNAWKEVGFYQDHTIKDMLKVGYPFATNSMLLMYNKEMFDNSLQKTAYKAKYKEDLVIPTTWEQFLRVASFFTQPQNNTFGVCLEGASGGWLYYEWMNFLYGMGGKIMEKQYGWQGDENSKLLLNSPESLQALKFYKRLKPFNAGNFTNVDQTLQMKTIKEGKTAMAIVWSDMIYPSIYDNNQLDTRFGFATVPGNKSAIGGGAFFMNRSTKHPKETAQYIVDLMQPKMQIELAKKGLSSALKTVYEDPEVKKIPYSQALYASLNRGGVIFEAGPDANMISEKVTTYVQKAWTDELAPEQALAKMQAEIETERKKIFFELKK